MKEYFPGCTKTKWMTRKFQLMPVRKMDNGHLLNTIRMLYEFGSLKKDREALELDCAAATCNGDGAVMSLESAANQLYDMPVEDWLEQNVPTWFALCQETIRRGLQERLPNIVL